MASRTLSDLVRRDPAAARVLDRRGIDYCCHGQRSLEAACHEAGIDVDDVLRDLDALPSPDTGAEWDRLSPAELVDHIVLTHHRYLEDELPRLTALAEKVCTVHLSRHPELAKVARLVVELRDELEPHLWKEERMLFPAIREGLDVGGALSAMYDDHERAGELLASLRATTNDYTVPDDGCASYRSLYDRLAELALDTHVHIMKENSVLFPAAARRAVQPSTRSRISIR